MNLMMRAKDTGELNVERVFARFLVIVGGMFWFFALAGLQNMGYTQVFSLPELSRAAMLGGIPLAITIGSFTLGLFYERLNGTLLVAAALGMILWGVFAHWGEVVLWTTALSFLAAPAGFAGLLYILASRTQEVQELSAKTAAN
jgi:fucose 4-O-acetylase-like acetyltransferase